MCTNHNQVISNYAKQFLTPLEATVNIKQVTDWTKRVVTSRACLLLTRVGKMGSLCNSLCNLSLNYMSILILA